MHSMRSTRSYLSRPMSDISYVDEDTLSPSAATHNRRSFGGGGSSGHQPATSNNNKQQQSGMMRHSLVVTDTSAFTPVTNNSTNISHGQQYLKVEGSSYRVHHRQQPTRGAGGRGVEAPPPSAPTAAAPIRVSADAQTQSAESSRP